MKLSCVRTPSALATLFAGLLAMLALPTSATAQATLISGLGGPAGFGTNVMTPGDDNSSAAISLTPYDPTGPVLLRVAPQHDVHQQQR